MTKDANPARAAGGGEDGRGAPVGRRVVLGMLAAGAAGVAAAPFLQRAYDETLGAAAQRTHRAVRSAPGRRRFPLLLGDRLRTGQGRPHLPPHGRRPGPPPHQLPPRRPAPDAADPARAGRPVRHRLAGARHPLRGRPPLGAARRRRCPPEAKAVRFTCFDGAYSESLTLAQARRDDVLVALRMQDKPLAHAHGGPVRLYVAPMYFYKSAKWLSGITVTDHVAPGYWENLGYDVDAWVGRSNGRDDAPTT